MCIISLYLQESVLWCFRYVICLRDIFTLMYKLTRISYNIDMNSLFMQLLSTLLCKLVVEYLLS